MIRAQQHQRLAVLCLVNLALLATHQVDAAYQEEWEMFGVPGGIDGFLLFNFVALIPLLHAYRLSTGPEPCHRVWSYAIPVTGLLTCAIHGVFLVLGAPEFTQTASLLILAALLLGSLAHILLLRTTGAAG